MIIRLDLLHSIWYEVKQKRYITTRISLLFLFCLNFHFVKYARMWVFSNPYFPLYEELWVTDTAKNTLISPNFLVWKFCGKAQFPHSFGRYSFHIVSGESPKTMWKLFLSSKFPHQEITRNYGIFRGDVLLNVSFLILKWF